MVKKKLKMYTEFRQRRNAGIQTTEIIITSWMKCPALPVEKKFEKKIHITQKNSVQSVQPFSRLNATYIYECFFYYIDKNDRSSFCKEQISASRK